MFFFKSAAVLISETNQVAIYYELIVLLNVFIYMYSLQCLQPNITNMFKIYLTYCWDINRVGVYSQVLMFDVVRNQIHSE